MARLLAAVLLLLVSASAVWGAAVTPLADLSVTGTATLVAVSNATRSALGCTNHSATVAVRWGNASVTATAGQRIPGGASAEITNRAAVYMISEGASVTVSCTEETQ